MGFIWGYFCQQYIQTVYVLGAGVVLASLVSCSCLALIYYFKQITLFHFGSHHYFTCDELFLYMYNYILHSWWFPHGLCSGAIH